MNSRSLSFTLSEGIVRTEFILLFNYFCRTIRKIIFMIVFSMFEAKFLNKLVCSLIPQSSAAVGVKIKFNSPNFVGMFIHKLSVGKQIMKHSYHRCPINRVSFRSKSFLSSFTFSFVMRFCFKSMLYSIKPPTKYFVGIENNFECFQNTHIK